MVHLEIERKFLIKMPDEEALSRMPCSRKYEIEQIYIGGGEARIRKISSDGEIKYFRTVKHMLNSLVRVEDETEISSAEYEKAAESAGDPPSVIRKTRWRIPFGKRIAEIDIYPFWKSQAVLEIEIEREEEIPSIPEYLSVIREVTGEKRYLNSRLAEELAAKGFVKL